MRWPVPGVQIVGKGAKNRAMARRKASEKKKGGQMDGPLPRLPAFVHSLSPARVFPYYLNAWDRLPMRLSSPHKRMVIYS